MTTEEKAKAYKKALERAKKELQTCGSMECDAAKQLFRLFPELIESEDERIRNRILLSLEKDLMATKNSGCDTQDLEQCIVWLEKQGINYSLVEEIKKRKDSFMREKEKAVSSNDKLSLGARIAMLEELLVFVKEKQGKQKTAVTDFNAKDWYVSKVDGKIHDMTYNPANKVEPKFKIGDWIVNDYCMGRVVELTNDAYLLDTEQGISFSCEHNVHLWTIQDAKDGDVLACGDKVTDCPFIFHNLTEELNPRSYCGVAKCQHFQYNDENCGFWCHSDEVRPATKEQRELLFKKMKEAGYEWDAEKKELKKIHVIDDGKAEMDYCFTKMMAGEKVSPAWSEEDEEMTEDLIEGCISSEKAYHLVHTSKEIVDWLKSLKDRMKGKED